ncbi:TPA: hypothetical protein ACH3X3_012758 [Trebouxia sp. C0006]
MSLRIAAYRCVPCVPCGPCISVHTLQRFKSVAIPIGNTGEGLFLDVNYADTPLLSNPPSPCCHLTLRVYNNSAPPHRALSPDADCTLLLCNALLPYQAAAAILLSARKS